MKPYTAHKIYTLLVELGANDEERYDFVAYMTRQSPPCREYRFGGLLGFGGKFYRDAISYRVGYHPDDFVHEPHRMAKLDVQVAETNKLLKALHELAGEDW